MNKLIVVAAFGLLLWPTQFFAAAARPPLAVYLFPHQDDEMFMLGSVRRSLTKGERVYAVMVTDGAASAARRLINRTSHLNLDRHAFTVSRNHEFLSSMLAIGVAPNHIIFANPGGVEGSSTVIYRDNRLTFRQAARLIHHYYKLLGDGAYNTVSGNGDYHPDHLALYHALRDARYIGRRIFFSERVGVGTQSTLTPDELALKRKALANYYLWEPGQRRYAVGAHSVRAKLDAWRNGPAEYFFTN